MKAFDLKRFDAYPKTIEDVQVRTSSGAVISIVSGLVILVLVISEFSAYLSTQVHHELYVDTSIGEQLQINFDLTFPRLPCVFASVDLMDVSGKHELDVEHNIFKRRLQADGQPVNTDALPQDLGDPNIVVPEKRPGCGSCYSAERSDAVCCNTCAEVMEAYRARGWAVTNPDTIAQCAREGFSAQLKSQHGEGCQIYGTLLVSKNHHMHIHDVKPLGADKFDLSHTINHLSFGHHFPGLVNPLDGSSKRSAADTFASMYQYFIKVVPTVYESLDGASISTNQFSVTEHFRALEQGADHGLPGVFFIYDLSPIMVNVREYSPSFGHFLTGVCAIVGGVFTVAGMIDSLVYRLTKSIKK